MNKPFKRADICLPNFNEVSPEKWAVIACDQFTSEPKYWESVKNFVGDSPSTLSLIIPEVYLAESDVRVPKINATMNEYLNGVLNCRENALIYLERTQSDGSVRRGIMLAVDLEAERKRLMAELDKNANEIKRLEGKLNNQGFVAKAPAAVVEGEKAKLEKYKETLAAIEAALAKLA